MALTALLLIALLLPGCVLSRPNGQVDQGQQRGLLEALQKLRLLNFANGRQQSRRYAYAPAQHQQSQQALMDIASASQNVSVFPDLDSLLRNRLKRDPSLMVQINVFNSAGRGCWHRRTASPTSTPTRANLNTSTVAVYAFTEIPTKAVPVSVPVEAGKMPWVSPETPLAISPIKQRFNVSGVDGAASAVVENLTAGAPEMYSAVQNVQSEKDVIHSIPAPSYSDEASTTLTDGHSLQGTDSDSRVTQDASLRNRIQPVPFFPKQSFYHNPTKPAFRIPMARMTARLGHPPPLIKVTLPVFIPPEDELGEPALSTVMENPSEPENYALSDPSGCLQSFSVGLNCDNRIFRGKASGAQSSPLNNLIRKAVAPIERRNMDRSVGATAELCECSDTNNAAKKKNGFKPSDVHELLFKPEGDALQRIRTQPQKRLPAKIFGSLRYPPPNDIAYEYATTYVYEDYVPSAYYEAQPRPQPPPPPQRPPPQPSQASSRQQPLPLLRVGMGPVIDGGGGRYEQRNTTNHAPGVLAADHRPHRLKWMNGTSTTMSPLKRIARDLQALEETAKECPCASTRKPPCTKTPKKCVKKRPCTKKVKQCRKRCRKKTDGPNAVSMPVTF